MHRLLNQLTHSVLPLLLAPVASSGLVVSVGILGLPDLLRNGTTTEQIFFALLTLAGIAGTIGTFLFLRAIYRRDPSWRVFELGRTAWILLLSISWALGMIGGVVFFWGISG